MTKEYTICVIHPRSDKYWTSEILKLDEQEFTNLRTNVIDVLSDASYFTLKNTYGEYFFPKEFLRECVIKIEEK